MKQKLIEKITNLKEVLDGMLEKVSDESIGTDTQLEDIEMLYVFNGEPANFKEKISELSLTLYELLSTMDEIISEEDEEAYDELIEVICGDEIDVMDILCQLDAFGDALDESGMNITTQHLIEAFFDFISYDEDALGCEGCDGCDSIVMEFIAAVKCDCDCNCCDEGNEEGCEDDEEGKVDCDCGCDCKNDTSEEKKEPSNVE